MKQFIRIFSVLLAFLFVVTVFSFGVSAEETVPFAGSGKVDDPYLIQSAEDLITLRDQVHGGNDFKDLYFLQTEDIDLASSDRTRLWEPIGSVDEERFFFGIYNGGGHVLRNLNVDAPHAGLFSFLGGAVMNLGIEGGHLNGAHVGAFASHAAGGYARILNCYSIVSLSGYRTGGLADNFYGGTIVDSWSLPTVTESEISGGLVAYGVNNIIDSFSLGELEPVPQDGAVFSWGTVKALSKDESTVASLKKQFQENSRSDVTFVEQILRVREGDGTEEAPYVISTAEQLSHISFVLRMGYGSNFHKNYFVQQNDFDLNSYDSWFPIGTDSIPFGGIYNGAGHTISNLRVQGAEGEYVGLFGNVSGTVMNVGIESGLVTGDYAAGLVGKGDGVNTRIVNCYNRAEVVGNSMAAGIAVTLSDGFIVNCLNMGTVTSNGPRAGICVESVGKIQNCFSVGFPVVHEEIEGIVKQSCRQVDSAAEAVALLNDGLYDACTLSTQQKNILIRWADHGGFTGEIYNYFLQFLIREIAIAILVFAIGFFAYILYRTSVRTQSLRLGGCRETLAIEKKAWFLDRESRIQSLMVIGFLVGLGMLLVGYLNQDSTISLAFSWQDQNDGFMDFFNPLRTVLTSNYFEEGHYTNPKSNYPPIIKGILWIFGQLLPGNMHFWAAKSIRTATVGLLLAFVIFMLCYFILLRVYRSFTQKKGSFLPLCALFSSPMIFLMDRGNTVLFVLVLSALFVAGYRSKNPLIRHLSYVSLGLAAAIKIYPAALGLLVLREKNKKHIAQCIGYGIGLCLVPFFIIGIDELLLYARNVTSFVDRNMAAEREWLVDYSHVMINISDNFLGNRAWGEVLAKYTLYPFTLLLVGCALLTKDWWKSVLAVILIQILFPGVSVYYCASFLAIPMLIFVGVKNKRKLDYLYAVLFVLPLVPLQFLCGAFGVAQYDLWMIAALSGFSLAILLIVDCTMEIVARIRNRKNAKVKEFESVSQ